MPSAFPSPVNQSTRLADYALSGSFPIGDITVHHVTDALAFGKRRFWFTGIDPADWMPTLGLSDPDTLFPLNYGLFVVVAGGVGPSSTADAARSRTASRGRTAATSCSPGSPNWASTRATYGTSCKHICTPTTAASWTPGHTCVLVADRGQSCLLVGDIAHHPVHFRHHDWLPQIDFDPPASIASRAALCELAIGLDAIVTAPHMPILTLGKLAHDSSGAVTWTRVDPADLGAPSAGR